MNDYMTQVVGNVFHRRDNGEDIVEIFKDIRKKFPESWKTILFHFMRLDGRYDNLE
jgi:hypothetical protein